MGNTISVKRQVEAVQMSEGSGATVRRLFPTRNMRYLDPFALLDEFTVTPSASFPEHPHGGFEALTYMLSGSFRHRDNLGNDEVVSDGGVQRFAAGKQIVHAELPGSDQTAHGLQLWVNLPKELKEMEPDYEPTPAGDIPERVEGGMRMRTVVGEGSPVKLRTPIRYLDVSLEGERTFEQDLPSEWSGLVYVLNGEVSVEGSPAVSGVALVFDEGGGLEVKAHRDSRFALIAGKPHGQPIHHHGSFVD